MQRVNCKAIQKNACLYGFIPVFPENMQVLAFGLDCEEVGIRERDENGKTR